MSTADPGETGLTPQTTCVVCGKAPDEATDPRQGESAWYCSRYCQLHDEVERAHNARSGQSRGAHVKPLAKHQRFIAFIFTVVIIAALGASVVVASGGRNLVDFHQSRALGEWDVRVVSVNWHAGTPQTNARTVAVNLDVRYTGAGEAVPPLFFALEGPHHVSYTDESEHTGLSPISNYIYSGAQQRFTFTCAVAENDLKACTSRFTDLVPARQLSCSH
jgi:hypothetical protein